MTRKSNTSTRLFGRCGKAGQWEISNTNGIEPAKGHEKDESREGQNWGFRKVEKNQASEISKTREIGEEGTYGTRKVRSSESGNMR